MGVYKRGKFYYMDFELNGKRVNRSTKKTDLREAIKVEALEMMKLEEQFKNGLASDKSVTFEVALERIYNERWKQNKDGYDTYRRVKAVLVPELGHLELAEIDAEVIERVITKLRREGAAEATLNRYRSYIKTIFFQAFRVWKAVHDIPYIKLTKESNGRMRVYTKEEEEAVLKVLQEIDPIMCDIVMTLADTGMRIGELLNLDMLDVDLRSGYIRIWLNKGDKPRSVPMTSRVHEILETKKGMLKPFPISYDEVSWMWDKARKTLGWGKEEILHALRHTCASRLVQAGVDLYVVKEYLGHSSILVTQRYAHLRPSQLRGAAQVLEQFSSTSRI